MEALKTYNKPSREDENLSFRISKMADNFKLAQGKPDEPHRHDFFTILIIKAGKGIHKIDFNSYPLAKNEIHFINPGQVHQLIEEEASEGFAILFSNQFLIENSIPHSFVESLNLFHDYGESPPLPLDKGQFSKIDSHCENMFDLMNQNSILKDQAIGAYLKLLLIECNHACKQNPIENNEQTSSNHLIGKFKKLVDLHFGQEHGTSFYAEQLNISSDHLNRIIKSSIGKTAKEYIQSRIIIGAKRLIYFTPLSTKEIGFQLGFNEPANFSAFFKNCTGLSISNFKKKEHVH